MVPAETFAPTEPPVIHPEDTPAGRAQKFLMDVTDRMGVKVDVYVDDSKADNLSIHMIGDTLGILIGRRGETLDALQYLTSLQVNKGARGLCPRHAGYRKLPRQARGQPAPSGAAHGQPRGQDRPQGCARADESL